VVSVERVPIPKQHSGSICRPRSQRADSLFHTFPLMSLIHLPFFSCLASLSTATEGILRRFSFQRYRVKGETSNLPDYLKRSSCLRTERSSFFSSFDLRVGPLMVLKTYYKLEPHSLSPLLLLPGFFFLPNSGPIIFFGSFLFFAQWTPDPGVFLQGYTETLLFRPPPKHDFSVRSGQHSRPPKMKGISPLEISLPCRNEFVVYR